MAADIDELLDQVAAKPIRQLDVTALKARRQRRRDVRRVVGAGVTFIVLVLAVVMLPRLTMTHVVLEPADQPAGTATSAPRDPHDADDAGVPAPAREGDVIKTEGVPAPASEVDAP